MRNQKIFLLGILFFFLIGTTAQAKEIELIRVSGQNRFETSSKVSDFIYEKTARNVVIVSGENYPDGLTGGVLASALDGSVLLTAKDFLPPTVKNEVRKLKPQNIYLLGGEASVSKEVENELKGLGNVIRISGKDRYKTATKVAEIIFEKTGINKNYIGIANGENFPDALAASAYFSNTHIPLTLATKDALDPSLEEMIKERRIQTAILIGGDTQLDESILPYGTTPQRLSGKNRYSTSVKIAEDGYKGDLKYIIIASGETYPDALSAAPLANALKAPILLTSKSGLSKDVEDYIKNSNPEYLIVIGGEGALPNSVFRNLNILEGPPVGDPTDEPIG